MDPEDKMLMQLVPLRLGMMVRVLPRCKFASEWPGVYFVTGMQWDYQKGPKVNVWIASKDDIQSGAGPTDGWDADDLAPV